MLIVVSAYGKFVVVLECHTESISARMVGDVLFQDCISITNIVFDVPYTAQSSSNLGILFQEKMFSIHVQA